MATQTALPLVVRLTTRHWRAALPTESKSPTWSRGPTTIGTAGGIASQESKATSLPIFHVNETSRYSKFGKMMDLGLRLDYYMLLHRWMWIDCILLIASALSTTGSLTSRRRARLSLRLRLQGGQ